MIFTIILVAICLLVGSCAPKVDERRIVRVEGSGYLLPATAIAQSFFFPDTITSGSVALLRDGDLMGLWDDLSNDGFFLPFHMSDGPVLRFEHTDFGLLLNGKVVAVELHENEAWNWVRQADERDLKHLRLLLLDDVPADEGMQTLEKIAKVVPGVGISTDALRLDVLRLFKPRLLVVPGDSTFMALAELEASRFKDVRYLWLKEAEDLAFLTAMPRLHTLLLENWDPSQAPLPDGLRQLRALTADIDTTTLGRIDTLNELRELFISFSEGDDPVDLRPLASLTKLESFGVYRDNSGVLSLPEQHGLRFLGLMCRVTQMDLDTMLQGSPNLETLAVLLDEEDAPYDLAHIKDLHGLVAMSILQEGEVPADRYGSILSELKSLRILQFISVDPEALEETAEALRISLPACHVSVVGICLGSGWILVLPVLIWVACFFSGQIRQKGRPVP